MIISKKLLKERNISHGFFNKNGGKSKGIYKSLNCGQGSKDKKIIVKKNLKIVKNKISRLSKNIILLSQVHSNKFIFINEKNKFLTKKIKGDALITDQINVPIGILTADCVPILLYDKKKKIIAAIHAGWKGAFKGIVHKVVNFLIKKGCTQKNIIAAIGPCIGKNSYDVREDLKGKFLRLNKKNKIFFKEKKK